MIPVLQKIKNKLAYELYKRGGARSAFTTGYSSFLKTGVTTSQAYAAMRQLYYATNGSFTETKHQEIAAQYPPHAAHQPVTGVLGTLTVPKLETVRRTLRSDGYVRFGASLPKETVSRLAAYALTAKTRIPSAKDTQTTYDPVNPVSEIYRFDMADLIQNENIQALIMDPSLIAVARAYLECEPVFDFPAMWWSTSFLKEASAEAAQLYHFDLDRIKWLKLFIYLTEVTPENGPHCYVKGTHTPGNKPQELLNRGYARIPDTDIQKYYSPESFVEMCGPAGTIFFGDTNCWHKGTPLQRGHRLVLELQYTSSLFGATYPKLEVVNASETFKAFCPKEKRYASNIHFKD